MPRSTSVRFLTVKSLNTLPVSPWEKAWTIARERTNMTPAYAQSSLCRGDGIQKVGWWRAHNAEPAIDMNDFAGNCAGELAQHFTIPIPPTLSASRLRRNGAMAAFTSCILSKSPTPLELTVRKRSVLIALTRVPEGPSSLARYRTLHSSAAEQIPIRL